MKTIAIISDLFFAAKIRTAANALGAELYIIKNKLELEKQLENPEEIYKIIVDLNFNKFDIFKILVELKKKDSIYMIGYLSHVQVDLRKKAEKYCDLVLSRSDFSARLPELLS
ncbi:MAG: response regulator [Nanoarchaeota archaeon]